MRPINVTSEVYRKYLVRKFIPAIRRKWPSSGSRTVLIQQDNAKPHVPTNDSVVVHEDILNESYESSKDVRDPSARQARMVHIASRCIHPQHTLF